MTHSKKTEFGTVMYGEVELRLTQNAYIISDTQYQANAVDDVNNDYQVNWDIINIDCDDESNACNWDKYSVIKL